MTCRCNGTITRNHQHPKLQWLIPSPMPNLPQSLGSNQLQHNLRFKIPYTTKIHTSWVLCRIWIPEVYFRFNLVWGDQHPAVLGGEIWLNGVWCYDSLPQQANKMEFPTLFSIAMDYLLVQATSVPCKCIFSSAKDTDTMKWNWISPVFMEALQMLKHMLKKECLNFMKGWSTEEVAIVENCRVLKATGLSSLFKDKPDIALDTLLKRLSNYNWSHILISAILCTLQWKIYFT